MRTVPEATEERLDERIRIQVATQTTDSLSGDEIASWSDLAVVWASATPLGAREHGQPSDVERGGDAQVRFRFRYSSTVSAVSNKHRIVWRAVAYDVESVIDLAGRRAMIEAIGVRRS